MFETIPSEWAVADYLDAKEGYIYSCLSYSEYFGESEDTEDNMEFAKTIMIASFESWLNAIDAEAYRAVWKLSGIAR